MINIVYEDNHLLVVEKPYNLPVNADSSGDPNLLDCLKSLIKERDHKPGNVFLALVHRLDRPVGGIMVFAKTSKAAARLSEQFRQREVHKSYLAVVCGLAADSDTFQDKLLKDHDKNLVKVDGAGKEAKLQYRTLARLAGCSLVEIKLLTGRSHQIRVQFAYHNLPLWGDQKYNPQAKKGQQLALYSQSLAFQHPISKETLSFSLLPQFPPFDQFKY